MMASEYKKAMNERGEEPYTTDKSEQSESQKHLNEWTKEDWQTSDGQGKAKQDDGTEKRYLPKKAWENMTEEEKEETNAKKVEGSAKGEQVWLYARLIDWCILRLSRDLSTSQTRTQARRLGRMPKGTMKTCT